MILSQCLSYWYSIPWVEKVLFCFLSSKKPTPSTNLLTCSFNPVVYNASSMDYFSVFCICLGFLISLMPSVEQCRSAAALLPSASLFRLLLCIIACVPPGLWVLSCHKELGHWPVLSEACFTLLYPNGLRRDWGSLLTEWQVIEALRLEFLDLQLINSCSLEGKLCPAPWIKIHDKLSSILHFFLFQVVARISHLQGMF